MSSLQLLLVILPLGLDTLGVSISLGIKSSPGSASAEHDKPSGSSSGWLRVALLFSLAEMLMPVVGLGVGYAVSLAVSNVMHYVGPVLLIGVGAWELWEEGRGYLRKKWKQGERAPVSQRSNSRGGGGVDEGWGPLRSPSDPKSVEASDRNVPAPLSSHKRMRRGQPFLLALSVSLDELAIGFSLGSITSGKAVSPLLLCLLIGAQGFLLTVIGLSLGRMARARLKAFQEGSEYLSALLLIGLGVWLLVS